jgi:hypothetical protein
MAVYSINTYGMNQNKTLGQNTKLAKNQKERFWDDTTDWRLFIDPCTEPTLEKEDTALHCDHVQVLRLMRGLRVKYIITVNRSPY